MSLTVQGAHRGRPVAAAPCTPGLRPAKSPLRGAFDFSLQASGRAEAASVQNTALSPHPCGLPRPSGNVSAILRPSAPAVSATMVNKLTTGRTNSRPGHAQPPPGTKSAPCPLSSPGGAALTGPTRYEPVRGPRRPGKAEPPPGIKVAPCLLSSSGGAALTGPTRYEPVRGPRGPGKAQPPPGIKVAPCLLSSPGGAALTGPARYEPLRGTSRPGKA
ncbi:hypothetical protein BANRA_03571 [Klebsiella quasipneumoniae]|nr:hypothetical protein BANRA_03571 [Klebsiella quasipneumoniae]